MPPTTSTPLLVNGTGSQWALTVSSAVLGLTPPAGGPYYALIQVETNNIRLTEDGTTPTSTNGFLIQAGQAFETYVPGRVKMLRSAGVDATVQVGYYN
jgi:hypothetical protein